MILSRIQSTSTASDKVASAAAGPGSAGVPAPSSKKPYSPFQVSKSNKAEYVMARLDDLLNWGRKVSLKIYALLR